MSNIQALSDVQVVLLAAQFISDVDVQSLQILASVHKDILTRDIIYRLLLTLYPSNETARTALLALLRSVRSDFDNVSHLDTQLDLSSVAHLSPAAASKLANQLHLASTQDDGDLGNQDALVDFVIAWVRHVEVADGALDKVLPVIDECASESPLLETWSSAYLLPVSRLRYTFYPGDAILVSLQELEFATGLAGVKLLLRHAETKGEHAEIGRDIDQVVSPWVEGAVSLDGRRKASWSDVNQWILDTSLINFDMAAKALLDWNGPPSASSTTDVRAAFAQVGFGMIYASTQLSEHILRMSQMVFDRIVDISAIFSPDAGPTGSQVAVADVSDADLLRDNLLREGNKLTHPSSESVSFLRNVLRTAEILLRFKIYHTFADIAHICISSSEERQQQEMRRILQQVSQLTASNPDWRAVRQDILWLRSWSHAEATPSTKTYLGHVPIETIEESLLDSMLAANQYSLVKQLYLDANDSPLDRSTVAKQVLDAVYAAYDNATNCNRTRGRLKDASELLSTFQPSFPEVTHLRDIEHLLKATHGLSFYQLTLQHGVPFKPVNIRAHQDPIDLVGRVLDQDSKAYTKLDDLLDIGRNLVLARLVSSQQDLQSQIIESGRRIIYLAIQAALAAQDFDTAYSYLTTRLPLTNVEGPGDDYAWRAAYAAGRYRPLNPPKELHDRIGSLSKRMDLLSLSLTLAPQAESLSEILGQWRRCEEEMETLKATAADEERAVEGQGEFMPGGFGMQDDEMDAAETRQALAKRRLGANSTTYDDEAPMGLFDVAKGAASALRRSAFPLSAGSVRDLKVRDGHNRQGSDVSLPRSPTEDSSGRVRKRDMVSSMVTNGLVSGIGWAIGADPGNRRQPEDG
jgi:protein transport protein SEC39